jgi:hypothetical protein
MSFLAVEEILGEGYVIVGGREVYSMNQYKTGEVHEFIFDASNIASGLYYYRIESDGFVETKKMLFIK